MKVRIPQLALKLKDYFENELQSADEIPIFLCGGSSPDQRRLRLELGKQISQIVSKYTYSVHYPEDMFIELISGHHGKDLLTLENVLANSVHCVVILLQSPGTFTELGAFSNHAGLCNKLVVVIDNEYKGKRSFISLGPIRYLSIHTKSKVLYSYINFTNLSKLTKQVADASREIPKQPLAMDYLANPIASLRFYLALTYVFDPFPKTQLFEILKNLPSQKPDVTDTVAQTVINNLVKRQEISIDSEKLSITKKGIDNLLYTRATKKRTGDISSYLSGIRLEALNLTMRK